MSRLYEKVFTREFTLPWLEIWYKGEAKTPRVWNNQPNKFSPYIVFVYHDDTVTSYYDPEGLNWSRTSVLDEVKKDNKFTDKIRIQVTPYLEKIKTFLDKNTITDKTELLDFFSLFQEAYPWLLAMWEIGESETDKLENLDVASVLELKQSTVTLTDDMDNLIRNSLLTMFPELGEYCALLTLKEIKSDAQPDIELLKKRSKGFVMTDGKIYRTDQIKAIESKFDIKLNFSHNLGDIKSITGNPASFGKAVGTVRKIMAKKHMLNFQNGEILVSPMTMPDFVPAMRKAAAIVTDEGGITCHAAIIARELGVPCVVGTGIATEILQNGDRVEVDATKGIVIILNH